MGYYIIGIDGGGTHTKAALVYVDNSTCQIMATATGGASNPYAVDPEIAAENVWQLINEGILKPLAPDLTLGTVSLICLGSAGLGRKGAIQTMRQLLREAHPELEFKGVQLLLTTDADIALRGGSLGKPAILIISGTGSIVYYLKEDRTTGRVGGWGQYLGDEGSGFHIGLLALKAVLNETISPLLGERILPRLGISDPGTELVNRAAELYTNKTLVADIAPFVFSTFQAGDRSAKEILEKAASELAELILIAVQRIGGSPKLIGVGGNFEKQKVFKDFLQIALHKLAPQSETPWIISKPELPPIAGAVILALQYLKLSMTETVINTLRSLKETF